MAHLLQMHIATVHQVYQAAWRCHDDLHSLLQGTHLRLYRSPAVDSLDMDALHIFAEVAEVVGDLQAQLPGGTEDEGLRAANPAVYMHQQGDAESRRLTRTRLCQSYHVPTGGREQERNYRLLHRHRLHKA